MFHYKSSYRHHNSDNICQIFVYPLEKPVEQTNWCWDKQCQNVCKRTSLPWRKAHKRCFTLAGSRILSGVNFTNILWAAFAPKSFRQKITNPNCKHIKELWYEKIACKILVKLTVMPKFLKQLLSAYNLGL